MLMTGLERLVAKGACGLNVGYGTAAARVLYTAAGFGVTATKRSARSSSSRSVEVTRRRV
jgi:hypothetical protein